MSVNRTTEDRVTLGSVPLPPGAESLSTWDDWDYKFRVIYTERQHVEGTGTSVWASAIQLADGTIDPGVEEPPLVSVDGSDGITTDQARQLAALLVAAADTLDGWVAGSTSQVTPL